MNLYDGNGCQFLPLAKELRQIAEILEARGMSAELINMTLAARAGLPVAPVDPKSPIFVWEKGEECEVSAPEAQPCSLDERRKAVFLEPERLTIGGLICKIRDDLLSSTTAEGVDVDFEITTNCYGELDKTQKIGLRLQFRQQKASK